jgi:hypothetical protein
MGLFGKKKNEDKPELPPLQFPDLPSEVPSFESGKSMQPVEAQEIKSAVSPQFSANPFAAQPSPSPMQSPGMGSEQPLFVKIEKYRDVVKTLKQLRNHLNQADDILAKLNRLKAQEDRELSAWSSDLEKIRNRLLDVDQKLFENG